MRILGTLMLVLFAVETAEAACSPKKATPTVRVKFEGCPVGDTVKVKIDGQTEDARKIGPSLYEADFSPGSVNALMPLDVPEFSPRKCCVRHGVQKKFSTTSRDCYVYYEVTCDQPKWSVAGVTADPPVTIQMERAHSDGVGGSVCSFPGFEALRELSANDEVIVKVIVPDATVDLRVTLKELMALNGTKVFKRDEIERTYEKQEGQRTNPRNLSAYAQPLVDAKKKALPNSVTVKKK
jgi:hypothetical protein